MSVNAVMRWSGMTLAMVLSAAIISAPVISSAQQPTTRPPAGSSPAEKPAMDKPATGIVEGSVKKVDAATKSVQVSAGLLGLAGRTLEVDEQTQIQVDGRQGSLADLREGDKVKASYESRDGKNLATRIEVMPAAATKMPASPPSTPGSMPGGSGSGTKQ